MPATAPERLLDRLDWQVVRRLDGDLQGDYSTLFRGSGMDIAGLREYQPGDDVRAIDWNVTARMPVPYVRVHQEERDLTAWFLLDLSPSVDFGTAPGGRDKRAVLVELSATLGRVLTRRGNRVGAMLYASAVERTIPPRHGRPQVLRLIGALTAEPRRDRAPETDLGVLFTAADKAIHRRSLVVIVSDFLSQPGWEAPLGRLARRHDVLTVRLVDPREQELPDVGPVLLVDAETGERLQVDTSDRRLRVRFREAAAAREAAIRGAFARAGVEAATISTDDDLVAALVRLAHRRRLRRRTA
ncbi:MAG: DUF58 domain-containing protein [Chloroflexota bacterium]